MQLTELAAAPEAPFPPLERALREPDGLLAYGGDLSPTRLLNAYRHGCFPWFDRGQPILWWSPDPRLLLATADVHVSRSFERWLRHSDCQLSADTRFAEVIGSCATIRRKGQRGSWILPAMIAAYERLHELGHAHCVEATAADGRLVGGIYGVAIGRMFFGESMFSAAENGSKLALLGLCRFLQRDGYPLLDCQMDTAHLRSLGADLVTRSVFIERSRALCALPGREHVWTGLFGRVLAPELLRPRS